MRAGSVLGPFLFVAVERNGDVRVAFLVYLVATVAGFAWLVLARDRTDRAAGARAEAVRPWRIVRAHRRGLATAGIGALGVSLLRGSRMAIVPLWATHIGLSSSSAAALFAVSFVLALGNGFGAGIVMTLGADLTPEEGRASFLAVWRVIADGGTAAGPLVDAAVVAAGSLPLAGPVVAALGLASAAVVGGWLREPPHLARRGRAEAGREPADPASRLAPDPPA